MSRYSSNRPCSADRVRTIAVWYSKDVAASCCQIPTCDGGMPRTLEGVASSTTTAERQTRPVRVRACCFARMPGSMDSPSGKSLREKWMRKQRGIRCSTDCPFSVPPDLKLAEPREPHCIFRVVAFGFVVLRKSQVSFILRRSPILQGW